MLRYGSPLAVLAHHEVIHLPRSDAARLFHTRLKDRIGYRLQRPTKVCALTGSRPLLQKKSRGLWSSGFLVLLSSLSKLFPFRSFSRAAAPAARWPRQSPTGREGNGDGVVVDIKSDVLDKVHVSAFLSGLSLTTNHGGSALRPPPARHPPSRKADTLRPPIASHTD